VFSEIRKLYDIETILRNSGAKLKGSGRTKWCVCPLPNHAHHNFTPSFSIFWYDGVQRWKCHGTCNQTGDVIDLIGFLEIPGYKRYNGRLYSQAAETLTGGPVKATMPTPPPPAPSLAQWIAIEMYPPSEQAVEYAINRGIGEEQIEQFLLGSPTPKMREEPFNIYEPDKWLSIPTFHHQELMGIKLRNTTKSGIRYMSVPGSRKGLWNYDKVFLSSDTVLVVKGEIAGIITSGFGFLCCAPTGGESGKVSDIKTALSLSKNIVVGDNDKDPETDRKMKKAAEARAFMLNAELKFPASEYKDIDEWLLNDPSAEDVIGSWI